MFLSTWRKELWTRRIDSDLKFPWSDRLRILGDVAEGMAFLHDKHDSVHRDLKSGNVLLDREDGLLRGKIGDFGMSKFMSQNRNDEQNALQMKESVHNEVDVHSSMTNGLGTWYSIVEFENTTFSCFYRQITQITICIDILSQSHSIDILKTHRF